MTARKTRRHRNNSGPSRSRQSKPRNWESIIERLNHSRSGEMKIQMGSPGSAQVTRVRLLAEWKNLEATTVGATLYLRLPSG
jgi:hypothetical protein